ncbi:hypothetical protein CsatB_002133 [Cannabis sativa]
MAIKIDMLKAYDRMEWVFLRRVLEAFGFCDAFVNLVMQCVSTVSYSVLLNGKPLKKIIPGRGLRQGDPMSPYLFLLCNDILSRILDRAQDRGDLHGIKISKNAPAISHLMFADDTLLFARANTMEASIIGKCLKQFEDWSGQLCSKQKSGILYSRNCVKSLRDNIEAKVGISTVNEAEKYLGNPFVFSRQKKKDFDFLRSKLVQRLEGWKMRTLSFAGRMVAISSVASTIPSYTMSTYQLPLSSCRDLDAIIRKFWWNGRLDKQRFLATISWDALCRPKCTGGLGFRRMEDINNAFLAKLAWNLASGLRRPWTESYKAKYFPRDSFWSVQQRNSDSFVWKGILNARQLILSGSCTIIASGESIDIWFQPWIPWLTYSEFRDLMEGIRAKAPGLRSVADLLFRRTKQWNSNYLCFLFGVELGTKISTIQIATDLNEDLLIWKQSNNGNFSVKQAYLLNQGGRFGVIDPMWKWIWHGELHPRMRMTLWRALSGALPLGGKAGIPSNNCCFCPNLEENTLHLFVKCSFAAGLWFGSPVPLCTNAVHSDSLKSFVFEMGSNLDCAQRTRFLLCLAVIIDTIWNKRNALWHNVDEQAVNIGESLDSIHRKFWELSQIDEHGDTMSMAPTSPPSELQNLPTGNRLIFVDGSFKEGKIGAGILAWDRATMDWFFEAKASDGMSEIAAEVFAWFSAFQWAKKNNWDDFALISDSSIVLKAFSNDISPSWKCLSWFAAAIKLKHSFTNVSFFHFNRTYLAFVDSLAKSARCSESDTLCCKGEGFPPVDPIFSVANLR